MSDQDDRDRLRYLQLKQKASMADAQAPEQNAPLMQNMMSWAMGPDRAQSAYQTLSGPKNTATKLLNLVSQKTAPEPQITNRPAMDVIRNAPSILANSAAKVLPDFVSPESMATAAIIPALGIASKGIGAVGKPVLKGLGGQAEELLGMVPDSLKTAYQDASLMFSKGKKAASPLYEEGKALAQSTKEAPKTRFFDTSGILQEGPTKIDKMKVAADTATEHRKLFNSAVKLEEAGALDADTALSARKSMWKIKKTIPDDQFYDKLTKFNNIIKKNVYMQKADDLFKRGLMAESLRSILPRTASGKASLGKSILGAVSGMKTAFSPAALGTAATLSGLASRKLLGPILQAPLKAASAVALLQSMRDNQ